MFPLGHLALGYLSVALVQRVRNRPPPRGWILAATLLGTQLPDIVDKPLAYFGVLSSGRSLGHSLLVAIPVLALVLRVGQQKGYGEYAFALTVGVLSHYLGDTYRVLLNGEFASARFLLWPVLPAIDYPSDGIPPWVRFADSLGSTQQPIQQLIIVVAVAVWAYDQYVRRVKRRANATR